MLVDWFTTVAQIINFLILVWLLKRFLYKPILRAMDQREQRMVNALDAANEQRTSAENERMAFEKKSQELEQQKLRILATATEQANEERKRMISAARDEVTGTEARWREALDHEKNDLCQEFASCMKGEVFAVTRQILSDLAHADLEACIADTFIQRLKSLESDEKCQLVASLGSSSAVVIRSAFDLPEKTRRQMEATVRGELSPVAQIQFVTVPDIIGGIELCTNGHKVSWSIQNYLSSLEKEVEQVMEKKALEHVQSA